MVDAFSTVTMTAVVEQLYRRPRFFLDMFFPNEVRHDTESVAFDLIDNAPRVSPFVHPLREAKFVQDRGYKTKIVEPAYIKDKRTFNGRSALKRRAGEALGGSMSATDRLRANVADALQDQVEMLQGRLEAMAVEAIVDAKQTIVGEGYGTHVVDFERDPALDVVLAGPDMWNDPANVDRGSQLEDWAQLLKTTTNVPAAAYIMDRGAYKLLSNDEKFLKLWTAPRQDNPITLDPYPRQASDEARFMGTLGDLPIYVYDYQYVDPETNTLVNAFPANTVVVASRQVEGHRHFGAINDVENLTPAMFHPRSWVQGDPSMRIMILESAPLMVPHRPATLKVTVA